MDDNKETSSAGPVEQPDFSHEKMKKPEERFGSTTVVEAEPDTGPNMLPFIAILVILLIVVLAGLYYWSTTITSDVPKVETVQRPTAEQNNEPESTRAEAQTEAMTAVSTSDELPVIEADLLSTNLEELDTELNAIESVLDSAQ